jgi:hypothetical protein
MKPDAKGSMLLSDAQWKGAGTQAVVTAQNVGDRVQWLHHSIVERERAALDQLATDAVTALGAIC